MTTTPPPDDPQGPDVDETVHAPLAAPAPPAGALDAARSAALDAFDEVHGSASSSESDVRALSSARSATTWYQQVPLGAVAAVLAVIALVGAFTQVDLDADRDDSAASDVSDEAMAEGAGDSDDSGAAESGGEDEASAEAGAPFADEALRGSYGDVDALVADLASRYFATAGGTNDGALPTTTVPTTSSGSATGDPAPGATEPDFSACSYLDVAGVGVEALIAVEPTVIAGRPTLAVIYDSPTGLRVAVVDSDCSLLADRPL